MKCRTGKSGCVSRCVKFGVLAVVGIGALTWVVMQLWNCLLPDLFPGVSPIGYWQALGVLVLSRILFGGMRGGFHHGCKHHGHKHQAHWESLTEEERQQLKGRFHGRWGHCCTPQAEDSETPAKKATDKLADQA